MDDLPAIRNIADIERWIRNIADAIML